MSWRVYMEIDTGGPEPYMIDDDYLNYTYNVSPMYYDTLGEQGLRGLHGMTGDEASDLLLAAELLLSDNPEKYEAMNPPSRSVPSATWSVPPSPASTPSGTSR